MIDEHDYDYEDDSESYDCYEEVSSHESNNSFMTDMSPTP